MGGHWCFMTFNLVLPMTWLIMPYYLCCSLFLSHAAADTRQAGSLNLSISVEHLKINDSGGAVREREERERRERETEREGERERETERERERERNV